MVWKLIDFCKEADSSLTLTFEDIDGEQQEIILPANDGWNYNVQFAIGKKAMLTIQQAG